MGKNTKILDGCTIVNIALSEGGYNYYGYVRTGTGGAWVIMRENTAQTEYRYIDGADDYATAWSARASKTYIIPINR